MFSGKACDPEVTPFYVSPRALAPHYKEVKADAVPFLYTYPLTSCIGIGFSLKDDTGKVSKIGLYHSVAEHSDNSVEDIEKYLSDPARTGSSAKLIQAVDSFFRDVKKLEDFTISIHFNSSSHGTTRIDVLLIYNLIVNVWNRKNPDSRVKNADEVDECNAFNLKVTFDESSTLCVSATGFSGCSLKDAAIEDKELIAETIFNFLSPIITQTSAKTQNKLLLCMFKSRYSNTFEQQAATVIENYRDRKITACDACRELYKASEIRNSKLCNEVRAILLQFGMVNLLKLSAPTASDTDKERKEFKHPGKAF